MPENNVESNLTPPSGSPEQAQKYLEKLIDLLNQEKILVTHTDLSKLDPSSLQNHYYITLNDYHIEVSHTKKADTGEDFYILLFNNLKQIRDGCSEKVILAYMNLTAEQFEKFKEAAKIQLDIIKAREDLRRFTEAMSPIDQALENLDNSNSTSESYVPETSVPEIPEPLNFAEASAPETPIQEVSVPEPPTFNQPIPENSTPVVPVTETPVTENTIPTDSLPEIPIFNEPVPQNSSPQTPTI